MRGKYIVDTDVYVCDGASPSCGGSVCVRFALLQGFLSRAQLLYLHLPVGHRACTLPRSECFNLFLILYIFL